VQVIVGFVLGVFVTRVISLSVRIIEERRESKR
jgi:hypothetical protein